MRAAVAVGLRKPGTEAGVFVANEFQQVTAKMKINQPSDEGLVGRFSSLTTVPERWSKPRQKNAITFDGELGRKGEMANHPR